MKKEKPEVNVEIAKACGWKNVHWYEDNAGPGFWSGIPSISEEEVFKMDAYKLESLRKYGTQIPDYCNDLNAMAGAERTLNQEQQLEYAEYLTGNFTEEFCDLAGTREHIYACATLTAKQKAEAFLLVHSTCQKSP